MHILFAAVAQVLEAGMFAVKCQRHGSQGAVSLLAEHYANEKDEDNLMRVLDVLEKSLKINDRTNSDALLKVHAYEKIHEIYQKYRDKGFIAFITSPFSLAIFCLCVGYFFNYIAIVSNNNHMPLFNDLSYWSGYTDIHSFTVDSFYILGDYKSKYIIFCDIIDLGYTTLSIGDVFIRFYPFVILFFSIKKSNEMKK